MAKASRGAEVLDIGQGQIRAFDDLGLLQIRLPAGCFRTVKLNLSVGAIAERLILGTPAAAERIALLQGILLTLAPAVALPIGIHVNNLLGNRDSSGDKIWAILTDFDITISPGRLSSVFTCQLALCLSQSSHPTS